MKLELPPSSGTFSSHGDKNKESNAGSAEDFDLDALLEEHSASEKQHQQQQRQQPGKRDSTPTVILPQAPSSYKRPDAYDSKRRAGSSTSTTNTSYNSSSSDPQLPDLLLPEDVVAGTPLDSSLDPDTRATLLSLTSMKQSMISAHTLLTTHLVLQTTNTSARHQLTAAQTELAESTKWRHLLADENARLRSKAAIVAREKENLQAAIERLSGDKNGLQKNEALKNEIKQKDKEIARL